MAVCIKSVCRKCNHAESRWINTTTEHEAQSIQNAINSHDDYSWTIENTIMTVYVW